MSIDYQSAFNLFVDILKCALPIGTTYVILERLVAFYFRAISGRLGDKHYE